MFVIFFVARIRRLLFAELSIQDGKLNIYPEFWEPGQQKCYVFSGASSAGARLCPKS